MNLAVLNKQSECLLVFRCFKQSQTRLLGGLLMLAAMTLQAQETAHNLPINGVQEQLHTDAIRLHKTSRFNANLPGATSSLSAQSTHACSYESDIAKKPPYKTVSLTFDDGPSPARTEFVLSITSRELFFSSGRVLKNTRSWCEKLRSVDDTSLATIPGSIPIFMTLKLSVKMLKLRKPSKS